MSTPQSVNEFEKAKDEAKARFAEFRKSYGNAVDRAKEHGDALLTLTAKCQREKKSFPTTLDELGIPRSTAYEHRKLASIWPEAQAVLRAGAEAGKTIPDMIRLVDPAWKLPKEAHDGTKTSAGTKAGGSKSRTATAGSGGRTGSERSASGQSADTGTSASVATPSTPVPTAAVKPQAASTTPAAPTSPPTLGTIPDDAHHAGQPGDDDVSDEKLAALMSKVIPIFSKKTVRVIRVRRGAKVADALAGVEMGDQPILLMAGGK